MSSPASQIANQDRLEVLLAMAIAYNQSKAVEETENEQLSEQIIGILSALSDHDLQAAREKLKYYEALTTEEKRVWQARVLSRVKNRNLTLDKDVHYTQIAQFIHSEPEYIGNFILQRLSPEIADNVAVILERKLESIGQPKSVNSNLENLVRRRFLSNFVARENLFEVKPLSLIAGSDFLEFIQRLGQDEIAIVCRGVKDVESLAPFLRRFDPADSQAILEQMANLRTIEKKRLEKAESLVKNAWAHEKDPALIVQLIGLEKLAAALSGFDPLTARYLIQKLPLNLATKISDNIQTTERSQSDIEMYGNEAETLAARILLEKMKIKE
jgi:hypothetical protein